MMIRKSSAIWEGGLKEGRGVITLGAEQFDIPYGFSSRFDQEGPGSNPEELIGGAHAGCFSMALAAELGKAGHTPTRIETTARVHFGKQGDSFSIPKIELHTAVDVPDLDDEAFQRLAQSAKNNCPVSKLLAAAEITLDARLLSHQGV
jgi:lipoyl-dependent peroxiredoxin